MLEDIDDLNKNQFMKVLLDARDRLGSAVKLSLAIGFEPRRLQVWTHGTMPLYSVMQDAYPKLVKVMEANEEEFEQIKKLAKRRRKKLIK